jgi:Helix-turn-helix domain
MNIKRVVGKNVRRYRIEVRLSQKQLANCMGVEQDYVSRLEAGRAIPLLFRFGTQHRPCAFVRPRCFGWALSLQNQRQRKQRVESRSSKYDFLFPSAKRYPHIGSGRTSEACRNIASVAQTFLPLLVLGAGDRKLPDRRFDSLLLIQAHGI